MASISRIQKSGDRPRTSRVYSTSARTTLTGPGRRSGAVDAHDETAEMDEGRAPGRRAAGMRIALGEARGAISNETPPARPALVEPRALSAVRLGGDPMTGSAAFDVAGRRRSPATMPGYHAGRAPRNKGQL